MHIRPFLNKEQEGLSFRIKVVAEGNFLVISRHHFPDLPAGHLPTIAPGHKSLWWEREKDAQLCRRNLTLPKAHIAGLQYAKLYARGA